MSAYRLLYSLLCYLIFPVILLRTFWRSWENPDIRAHWPQRLGFIEPTASPTLWLHAVSVGETIAAKPLVERLLTDFPNHQLLISSTTATGFQTSGRLFGARVTRCYFPYDMNGTVARFLRRSNPTLLIIMETEIWPNLLHQCQQQRIPVLIANARLSARSTAGYAKIMRLISPTLQQVSTIACRNQDDANNFRQLGANSQQLAVVGNIKFDIAPTKPKQTALSLKQQLGPSRKIWVAASTHDGEDQIIIDCYTTLKARHEALTLVLVPRHPERFDSVFNRCQQSGHITQRRSQQATFTQGCEIILGDSMGEMDYWYASADLVFLGGSFVKTGGHNPLEASIYGVPVVSGPTVFNFNDVYAVLCANQLAWIEPSPEQLVAKIDTLLMLSAKALEQIGSRAAMTFAEQGGATDKLLHLSHQLTAGR